MEFKFKFDINDPVRMTNIHGDQKYGDPYVGWIGTIYGRFAENASGIIMSEYSNAYSWSHILITEREDMIPNRNGYLVYANGNVIPFYEDELTLVGEE